MEKFNCPKICFLSLPENIAEKTAEKFETVYKGSIGKMVNANYNYGRDCKFLLNYDFPNNLHEYDLFFLDLIADETIEYVKEDFERKSNKTVFDSYFYTNKPQTIFDPRNYSLKIFFEKLYKKKQKSTVVVFAAEEDEVEYAYKNFSNGHEEGIDPLSNYPFLGIVDRRNKYGTEFKVPPSPLKSFFDKNLTGMEYHITFVPSDYQMEMYHVELTPLLYNKDEELVSFILDGGSVQFIILPDIKDRQAITELLLSAILPDRYPDLFPYSDRNNWINQPSYYLPQHRQLADEKTALEKKFEDDTNKINKKIEVNNLRFKFLHDIIQETGDALVAAVIQYFKWLGVKVVDKDKTAKILLEEDLQVFYENKMLIIEVKGIAGKPKDDDCSQIVKVRTRRMKELKRTDIDVLFLVNHQRMLPPLAREDPAFQPQQIIDAADDYRGLLTTWQLFTAYDLVQKTILTKKDVISALFSNGLVNFKPMENFTYLGEILEIHGNGKIIILKLNNLQIAVGDQLLVESKKQFSFVKILSLKLNNTDIKSAINGEIGIKVDGTVAISDFLYKRKQKYSQHKT